MKRNTTFSLWGIIFSALILVIFSVQNAQEVNFQFLVWRTDLSLSILLIVAFLLGVIVGAIFSFRRRHRISKTEKNKLKASSQEKQTSQKDSPETDKLE